MDTDPNPFRESPDSDRSASPTEAPDDDARDFAEESEGTATTTKDGSSPMSEGSNESSTGSSSDASSAGAGSVGESGGSNTSRTNPGGETQAM